MLAQGIAQRAQKASTKLKRAMVSARTALRASTGLLQDKPLKPHPARPVHRASTGLLPDKPLKHRARPAERASTGLQQDKPLKHPAGHVPRTRTRLLKAVLWLPALATQATVATMLAQGIAQRV